MENGEAVLAASLVEDQLRAREGTQLEVVPSPALLWAGVGVFRPGGGVTLLGAESQLGYFDDSAARIREAVEADPQNADLVLLKANTEMVSGDLNGS